MKASTESGLRIALDFLGVMPIQSMANAAALVSNTKYDNSRYCFAQAGAIYLVYLPKLTPTTLDFSGQSGSFLGLWFKPRSGGQLRKGRIASVTAGGKVDIGSPGGDTAQDWLAVIRAK